MNNNIKNEVFNNLKTTVNKDSISKNYLREDILQGILVRCCAAFGVTTDDVKKGLRNQTVMFARCAYCYLAYRETNISTAFIGEFINRNSSSVFRSIEIVERYLDTDYNEFTDIYNMLLVY